LTLFYLQKWIPTVINQVLNGLIYLSEIEYLMPLKQPADEIRIFWTLLKGQAFSYFEHHLNRRLDAKDSELPDNEIIQPVIQNQDLEYFPKCDVRVQE
jgi:hypothetical protein